MSFASFGVDTLAKLVLGIQYLVLPMPRQRQIASLSTQMAHGERPRKKQLGKHKQERPSNKWT